MLTTYSNCFLSSLKITFEIRISIPLWGRLLGRFEDQSTGANHHLQALCQNLDFDIGSNVSRAYFFSIWFSLKNEMIKSWDPPPSSIPPSPPLLQYFRIIGQLSQRARAPSRSPPKSVQCLAGGEHSELVSANYKVKQTNRLTANRLMGQQAGSSIWSEQQDELTISQTHTRQIKQAQLPKKIRAHFGGPSNFQAIFMYSKIGRRLERKKKT